MDHSQRLSETKRHDVGDEDTDDIQLISNIHLILMVMFQLYWDLSINTDAR
jgi:hypothetical protein